MGTQGLLLLIILKYLTGWNTKLEITSVLQSYQILIPGCPRWFTSFHNGHFYLLATTFYTANYTALLIIIIPYLISIGMVSLLPQWIETVGNKISYNPYQHSVHQAKSLGVSGNVLSYSNLWVCVFLPYQTGHSVDVRLQWLVHNWAQCTGIKNCS